MLAQRRRFPHDDHRAWRPLYRPVDRRLRLLARYEVRLACRYDTGQTAFGHRLLPVFPEGCLRLLGYVFQFCQLRLALGGVKILRTFEEHLPQLLAALLDDFLCPLDGFAQSAHPAKTAFSRFRRERPDVLFLFFRLRRAFLLDQRVQIVPPVGGLLSFPQQQRDKFVLVKLVYLNDMAASQLVSQFVQVDRVRLLALDRFVVEQPLELNIPLALEKVGYLGFALVGNLQSFAVWPTMLQVRHDGLPGFEVPRLEHAQSGALYVTLRFVDYILGELNAVSHFPHIACRARAGGRALAAYPEHIIRQLLRRLLVDLGGEVGCRLGELVGLDFAGCFARHSRWPITRIAVRHRAHTDRRKQRLLFRREQAMTGRHAIVCVHKA